MKITIKEIKEALKNRSFKDSLPPELKKDVIKYEKNPGCPCNMPLYKKIVHTCTAQLLAFYPGSTIDVEKVELQENNWTVINCSANELETKLKELPPGKKQISMARYLDQITVIVNELDF